jgi:SAM-dependent MidA family methyltransferase
VRSVRAGDGVNELGEAIASHIRATGPIGFDEYVAHALYTPRLGFYAGGGGAGRRRDFVTSPEVGPLFGAVVARAFDAWWDEAGQPSTFTVVEVGAGPGTLARAVLAAEPRCLAALRLVLVEPSQTQWATHPADGRVTSRSDLPARAEVADGPVVVLANELLDNLPFGLVARTDRGWCEVVVTADADDVDADGQPALGEGFVPLTDVRAAWCDGRAGRDAPVGTRLPVQADAAAWLAAALDLAGAGAADGTADVAAGMASRHGRVVVFDYAATTRELAQRPWTDWVRTYADQDRAGHPLTDPGSCDITVDVAVDQLATVAVPSENRSQADWLRAHGIDDLVEEGRQRWTDLGGVTGGLEAIAGRSRVHEADALLDPTGLGNFRVLEWTT